MRAFTEHEGTAAPLDRANVDTDQIIPKQYLKSIKRTGFGDYLFDAWRFKDEGDLGVTPNERVLNHEFVLNDPRYQGASILLARDNFGCGSSREHAVWSILEYGFAAVIAPSFADIFYSNCFKNGLLPIVLDEESVDYLFETASEQAPIAIDLAAQEVRHGTRRMRFEIDPALKEKMLNGMDDIDLSLAERAQIDAFEARHKAAQPWLFSTRGQS